MLASSARMPVDHRNNNFDCIRLVAALLVLFSHAFNTLNLPAPFLLGADEWLTPGTLGVSVFFVISGFLISASYFNNEADFMNYARSRVLRIFPALWVQYLFVALILGALVSDLPARDYYRQLCHIPYFFLVPFGFRFPKLPGVFTHNIKPNFVNVNLWTLAYETSMYMVLPVIFFFSRLLKKNMLPACTVVYGVFLFYQTGFAPVSLRSMGLIHCWTFLLGSLFYVYRESISLNMRGAVYAILLWYIGRGTSWECLTYTLSVTYLVIYAAFLPARCSVKKIGDLSYGVYLYSFPMEQLFALRLGQHFTLFVAASLAGALVLAALSWHGVEKRVLALKRNPGSTIPRPSSSHLRLQ